MGARPLGVAWTFAGYPGSKDFLTAALGGETCESIAASWILTEPDAPDSFSPDLLRPIWNRYIDRLLGCRIDQLDAKLCAAALRAPAAEAGAKPRGGAIGLRECEANDDEPPK